MIINKFHTNFITVVYINLKIFTFNFRLFIDNTIVKMIVLINFVLT